MDIRAPTPFVLTTISFIIMFSWLLGVMMSDMHRAGADVPMPPEMGFNLTIATDQLDRGVRGASVVDTVLGVFGLVVGLLGGIMSFVLYYPIMYMYLYPIAHVHGLQGFIAAILIPILITFTWIILGMLRGMGII